MKPDELASPQQLEMFWHPERYADATPFELTIVSSPESSAAARQRLGRVVEEVPVSVVLNVPAAQLRPDSDV